MLEIKYSLHKDWTA